MGKIKIYEIAKKLNLTSKEVLDVAQKLNIDVKSHLSGVEEDEANKIEDALSGNKSKKQEKQVSNKGKTEAKKEEKAPVIIRREVIISEEDEQEKKKEMEKKQAKKNNVGFVERKQNKDYNIVYRNKPSKPMTVSELFGLNKEEPKKEEVKDEKKEIKEEVKKETKQEAKPKVEETKIVKEASSNKEIKENKENKDNRQNRNKNNQNGNYRKNNKTDRPFNNNGNNRYNNNNKNNNTNNNRFGKRPLDARGIEKNIKNIMSQETGEKEQVREYNRGIDKQKNNNRFEDNNRNKKNKSRRNNGASDFDEGKLKSLKQTSKLSNMFDDQDGGMLDYYDLTTERGSRGT